MSGSAKESSLMRAEGCIALNNTDITDGFIRSYFSPNLVRIRIYIIALNAVSMGRGELMTLSLEALFIKDTFFCHFMGFGIEELLDICTWYAILIQSLLFYCKEKSN